MSLENTKELILELTTLVGQITEQVSNLERRVARLEGNETKIEEKKEDEENKIQFNKFVIIEQYMKDIQEDYFNIDNYKTTIDSYNNVQINNIIDGIISYIISKKFNNKSLNNIIVLACYYLEKMDNNSFTHTMVEQLHSTIIMLLSHLENVEDSNIFENVISFTNLFIDKSSESLKEYLYTNFDRAKKKTMRRLDSRNNIKNKEKMFELLLFLYTKLEKDTSDLEALAEKQRISLSHQQQPTPSSPQPREEQKEEQTRHSGLKKTNHGLWGGSNVYKHKYLKYKKMYYDLIEEL